MGPIRTDNVGKVIVPSVSDNAAVDATLRFIAQRAWRSTQEKLFSALVTHLAESLGVACAFVDKIADVAEEIVETIALYAKGEIVRNIEYDLAGTPCENVVGRDMCCYVDKIQQQFPTDDLLAQLGAESYPTVDRRREAAGFNRGYGHGPAFQSGIGADSFADRSTQSGLRT